MRKLVLLMAVGMVMMFGSFAFAAPYVDTVQYPTNYFVPNQNETYNAPYYRWWNQDWEWKHNAIGGSITTASLYISAWDVDAPNEVDNIYVKESGSWVLLGSLSGLNDAWGYTTFNLGSAYFDEIAAGLEVRIDIDTTHTSNYWAVTLAKSVLTIDGGTPPNPNPGEVPEPFTMLLLGLGLTGIAGVRRFKK